MSTARPDLQRERYGRRPASRRPLVVLAAVALAVTLGWVTWVTLRVGDPEVSWQDIGFRLISDGAAQVTFDVAFAERVDPARSAVCTVQAQNAVHTEVGRLDVTVGPARDRHQRVTRQLPTSERATTVVVTACALR